MKIIQRYESKKNKVYLVSEEGTDKIFKKFSALLGFKREVKIYKELGKKEIKIPIILKINENEKSIVMEKLEGRTALEQIEIYEMNEKQIECSLLLINLFNWLVTFHKIDYIKDNNLCLYDLNYRNFINHKNEIYGLDFESVCKGSMIEDAGRLIGMYLNYKVKHTEFKNEVAEDLKEHIISKGYFSMEEIEKSVANEILKINQRRKLKKVEKFML